VGSLGAWTDGAEVALPGGLVVDGRVEQRAVFRRLTGQIERAFHEWLGSAGAVNPARAVSEVLGGVLDRIGAEPADASAAARLCVADRHYLLLRLSQLLAGDRVWVRATCARCGVPFDVGVSRSELPVKPAGVGFPFAHVRLRGLDVTARVPTGADQEAIAELAEDAALRALVARCLVSVSGRPACDAFVAGLTDDEIRTIEDELDTVAPDVGARLATACPECAAEHVVQLDPFPAEGGGTGLYEDVHVLALYYHWTEADILALPRARRRLYLELIDRSRGVFA